MTDAHHATGPDSSTAPAASSPDPALATVTALTDAAPATPEPDTKDWTWVLQSQCPECGFSAADVPEHEIGATVRDLAPRWIAALYRTDAAVRPAPQTWSVLEYGAHVRDVLELFDARLTLMLTEDDARFENWDQDATAVAERYDLQDPVVVANQLADAAEVIADRFDAVTGDQWERVGVRSNGSTFTVRTFGQYFLHDVVHHLWDVRA